MMIQRSRHDILTPPGFVIHDPPSRPQQRSRPVGRARLTMREHLGGALSAYPGDDEYTFAKVEQDPSSPQRVPHAMPASRPLARKA